MSTNNLLIDVAKSDPLTNKQFKKKSERITAKLFQSSGGYCPMRAL